MFKKNCAVKRKDVDKMLKNIVITTDSGMVKKMQHAVIIPSCIQDTYGTCYFDQINMSNEEIYRRRNDGEKFKTASPLMSSFLDTWQDKLKSHDEIVHFSMSSEISAGSMNAAVQAANLIDPSRIHVVDSHQGGPGGGLVLEIANQLLEEGFSSQELITYMQEEILPYIKTTFLVPNPLGFLESGRNKTNSKKMAIWKEFMVKMLVKRGTQFEVVLKDGALEQDKMHRYNKEEMYLSFVKKHLEKEEEPMMITYGTTMATEEKMDQVGNLLHEMYPNCKTIRHDMGGVISSYACPNTMGISYIKRK